MTESEYQILLAAIVEASDVRYDAAKVVLTKLMGESVKPEWTSSDYALAAEEIAKCFSVDTRDGQICGEPECAARAALGAVKYRLPR